MSILLKDKSTIEEMELENLCSYYIKLQYMQKLMN